MANSFGDTYSTGTITLTNGSKTATFSGTLLTTQAVQGDMILVNGLLGYVDVVNSDTSIDFSSTWQGSNLSGVPYLLMKVSKSRYDPAITQQKTRDMLAFFEAAGFFYFVSGSAPDSGLGSDGQWALKTNGGDWRVWYHTGGTWVEQVPPTGIDLQGVWDGATTYASGVTVSWLGRLWKSKVSSNLNHQPDTSPTQWLEILRGGDRYDFNFFDTDRPGSNEVIHKAYPVGVTFYAGLSDSRASAEVASTGTVFFSFRKNGVEFGRLTFSPGNPSGVFTCPTQTTFAAGDKYTMIAPVSQDTTLSGVGGNLVGYR